MEHARPLGGDSRDRYPVDSIVRYQCEAGYTQRHLPVIRCMADGQWEEPHVECIEGESQEVLMITPYPHITSATRIASKLYLTFFQNQRLNGTEIT